MMYYVYILRNQKTGKLYKGFASDLRNRINEHNNKKVKSTKNGGKWVLIYYEGFLEKTDALREENFLKTGRGRERIKYLLKNTFKYCKGRVA